MRLSTLSSVLTGSASGAGSGGTPRSARRLIAAVLLLVVVVFPVGTWALGRLDNHRAQATTTGPAEDPTARVSYPPGTTAPTLRLAALNGTGTVDLASYRGHPVLVNFWASTCGPCKREFPLFRQSLAQHHAAGLVVIGVLVHDKPSSARAFMRARDATWPVGIDTHDRAITAFKVNVGIPQSFFVRRDGTLASRQLGELSAADLKAQLATILAR